MLRTVCLAAMVFLCGWVLMALEMVGPRLIERDFGSGIYVWGSVISVFLLALSVGYWTGGKASRRWKPPWTLAAIGFAVSAWILLIHFANRPVNDWLFTHGVQELAWSERWAALASAFSLFFVPSGLLGMISPMAIRLAASDLDRVGESAGLLYAVSTVGSFLGCLVTAFYLVDFGLSKVLLGHAASLAAGSLLFGWLCPDPKS
ncbi:MAG: fused MFS/spermidine synthase [Planctomycetes bacterium]|nr:fused MFS/spermidine synthase [Planctomycetota bacterium]